MEHTEPNLRLDTGSLSLRRFLNNLLGIREQACYTDAELRAALSTVADRWMTQRAVSVAFGVSVRTQRLHLARLRQEAEAAEAARLSSLGTDENTPSEPRLSSFVAAHELLKRGRHPLLDINAEAVLVEKVAQSAEVGAGLTRLALSAEARRLAAASAEGLPEGDPKRARLTAGTFGCAARCVARKCL